MTSKAWTRSAEKWDCPESRDRSCFESWNDRAVASFPAEGTDNRHFVSELDRKLPAAHLISASNWHLLLLLQRFRVSILTNLACSKTFSYEQFSCVFSSFIQTLNTRIHDANWTTYNWHLDSLTQINYISLRTLYTCLTYLTDGHGNVNFWYHMKFSR